MTGTASINGVTLTETQLRDGLAQIEAARSKRITFSGNYINIPHAMAVKIGQRAAADGPDFCVTLDTTGQVGYNAKDYLARHTKLGGFTA